MRTELHLQIRNPAFSRIPGSTPGLALLLFLLPVQSGSLSPDTDLIPTGEWTYQVTIDGNRIGELSSEIRRLDGRIVSTSDLTGSFIQRGSVTVLEGTLQPVRSSTFLYKPGEGSTTARLRYSGVGDSLTVQGNVTWGELARPPAPVDINRTIPADALFDNQSLDILIVALPLEDGGAWRVNIFEPTSWDHTITITIDIRGATRVTTPAGRFDVWRVEVRGFSDRIEYFFDRRTRVLIAQHVHGQELRLELVSEPD